MSSSEAIERCPGRFKRATSNGFLAPDFESKGRLKEVMDPDGDKANSRTPQWLALRLTANGGAPQSTGQNRSGAAAAILWVSLCLFGVAGCQSGPARAWQGARHYSVGTAALDAGEPARAIEELEAAARWVPEASEIQNHLGLAYWANGQHGRAEIAFARSVELDCENEAAQSNFARFQRALASPVADEPSMKMSVAPTEASGLDRKGEMNDGR